MDKKRPNKKSETLKRMAKEEFGRSLSQAERKFLDAVTTEDMAICGPNAEDSDTGNNPEFADKWLDSRSIDAMLIRWLCADLQARKLVDPSGIQVYGAKITGGLNLTSMVVSFPLGLYHCAIEGVTNLYFLDIPVLNLEGSWVESLMAQGIHVKGTVFLTGGFRANGPVILQNAQIGSSLDCSGGKFIPRGGKALDAGSISIGSDIYLNDKFRAEGMVSLIGAQIGGSLSCVGGEFINPPKKGGQEDGLALDADGISAKYSIFLQSRFEGEVRLWGARIGVSLACDRGEFINPWRPDIQKGGDALTISAATIPEVFLTDGFRAEGNVTLIGTRMDGDLHCEKGDFSSADLWLEEASARCIHDADSLPPRKGSLHLNGFVYRLVDPLDTDARLRWLELQPDKPYNPQTYLQLAKVLAEAGNEKGRTKILVAMKDQEWSLARRGLVAQVWRWPFWATAGYGYRPLMAFWEIMGLSALGWIMYRRSYLAGGVVPTEQDAYKEFKSSGQPPDGHRRFSPFIYSVENSLPLVTMGQAEKWQPDQSSAGQTANAARKPTLGSSAPWPAWLRWLQRFLVFVGLRAPEKADAPRSRVSRWCTSSKFLRWFLWAQILLGWLLATLFLAGVSGIIKKE